MNETNASRPPGHSAEYFGEARDYWWNPDFVELLARRWRLGEVHDALDVGAGVGHWGRVLAPHFARDAMLVGVDAEDRWVAEANRRAGELGIRAHYVKGDARALPFEDASFDFVTCQTVLIHVPDPRAALAEMLRVLRPGGGIVLAEPNNRMASLATRSHAFDGPIESILDLVRFQMICERGKAALGEGNNSIGEMIPGLLAQSGAIDVRVVMSDKAYAFVPPYLTRDEQLRAKELRAWAEREFWIWGRSDTERYFLAGGGTLEAFSPLWAAAREEMRRVAHGLEQGTLYGAGGGASYLVSGRKPG